MTSGLIDLHTHTTASDGSLTPDELVKAAVDAKLDLIAITDHDTFAGWEAATPLAKRAGLTLVRGIELNSRLDTENGDRHRSVHVLAYWPGPEPTRGFLDWILSQQQERRDRNEQLIASLNSRGIDITLAEVEAVGRSLTARPHFARVLVKKGYAANSEEAFHRYLGEGAPTYIERQSPTTSEVIQIVRQGGGAPVIAHPIRINLPHGEVERAAFRNWKGAGLLGMEVVHSEHSAELQRHYLQLAQELQLAPTGGSDFHGSVKPDITLGSGREQNVRVPISMWNDLRTSFVAMQPLVS